MFETFGSHMRDRCGARFGFTRLRQREKCEQGLGSSDALWRFGERLIFDENGRAWCPECFPDPGSFHRGYRSVHPRDNAGLLRPPEPFANYGSE
jgi:hypothetical protein